MTLSIGLNIQWLIWCCVDIIVQQNKRLVSHSTNNLLKMMLGNWFFLQISKKFPGQCFFLTEKKPTGRNWDNSDIDAQKRPKIWHKWLSDWSIHCVNLCVQWKLNWKIIFNHCISQASVTGNNRNSFQMF